MRFIANLRRFLADAKGNIAVLFGLAIIPVIGVIGAAVDYSLATASRTAVQAALDNTALMLAKMMPLDNTTLNNRGWQIFQSNLGYSPLVFDQTNFAVTQPTSNTINVALTNAVYNTKLIRVMSLVGMNSSFNVGTHTTVQWGNSRLRISLVLDNTGSMAQGTPSKISALISSTKTLIDKFAALETSPGDGSVYISIVPFAPSVNVDPANAGASWIDHTEWSKTHGSCSVSGGATQSACTTAHNSCTKPQYSSKNPCQNNGGNWGSHVGVWTATTFNSTNWDGCVMDRGTNTAPGTAAGYDQQIDLPGGAVPKWEAQSDTSATCTPMGVGLSYNWTSLKSTVDTMVPGGNTNQPIGLVWGWQTLRGGGPFTMPTKDTAHYDYKEYIILLTDGLNTIDRWYSSQTSIDDRMYYKPGATASGTCVNVKNDNISVFTVQVNTAGDPTSTLLQNCASDPSYFFLLTSSTSIDSAFSQIFNIIANLHVSQ